MATAVRRNTFVLGGTKEPKIPNNMSGKDRQNLMRLKVNRIAIVQELRVEHVLRQLIANGVLTEDDRCKIESGTQPMDQARLLIDILPTKPKETEWYKHFKEALLNPNAGQEIRKRYRLLVEFLDNTVIHRPTSQHSRFSDSDSKVDSMKYPKYEPLPSIDTKGGPQNVLVVDKGSSRHPGTEPSELEEKGSRDTQPEMSKQMRDMAIDGDDNMILIKGFFHQWMPLPDNFRSLLEVPPEHLAALKITALPEDKEQLENEGKALRMMRKLEVVAALSRRKQLPLGFELCMCDAVQEVLVETELWHLCLKHFRLLARAGVPLLMDVVSSYKSLLHTLETARPNEATAQLERKQAVHLGFRIVDLLTEFSEFMGAEVVMSGLMMFLHTSPGMETWMAKYRGLVKLMQLRNLNYNFAGVERAYGLATEVTWQIKMMSFGKDLLDESGAFIELTQLMLEFGSLYSAKAWANRALKEVEPENRVGHIRCLCVAALAYCSQWEVKKAGEMSVFAIQLARKYFGTRHPLYLKALLTFCHYSSEFQQDEHALEVAQMTLTTAKRVYACDTMQLAMAHRAVSKILMALQRFENDQYYHHAMEGIRVARGLLPNGHPSLHLFLQTFATALQWKALHCPKEVTDSTLRWAETEAKQALLIVAEHYGEISLRSAQVYSLLGQIYSKMDKLEAAEEHLRQSVEYMEMCQQPNSHYLLLSKALLGAFYKILDRPKDAIPLLCDVINNVDTKGFYLKWVHVCFEHLVTLLQSLGYNKDAEDVQIRHSHWLKDNPREDATVTMADLSEVTTLTFQQFLDKVNPWGASLSKLKALVK